MKTTGHKRVICNANRILSGERPALATSHGLLGTRSEGLLLQRPIQSGERLGEALSRNEILLLFDGGPITTHINGIQHREGAPDAEGEPEKEAD